MKNTDLEYIFSHIPYKEKNIYTNKILYSVQKMYMNYLKNNNINNEITNSKTNRRVKNIKILRRDSTIIATIKNPFYPTNARAGYKIVRNKLSTEKHLKMFNINTPRSKVYNHNDVLSAKKETFKNGDRPVVIKPLDMSLGRGVITNVTMNRFEYNWELSRELINHADRRVLVQNYIDGFEVRATIIEGCLLSVVARVPAYVLGNGVDSINTLIDKKNKDRSNCNYLKTMLIKKSDSIIEFLKSQSRSLDYIPAKNEYVLLTSVSNTSLGGEIINITDLVSEEIKDIALDSLASMPGLHTGGIDIMIKSFHDDTPYVIELNTFPFIMLAQYPTYGKSVNAAKYYVNSLIAKDQFLHDISEKYEIENEKQFIKNYLNFSNRKIKVYNNIK